MDGPDKLFPLPSSLVLFVEMELHAPSYDYQHCKLDSPARDLRILEIKRGNEIVDCELIQLDDQPYSALSWCWGSQLDPKKTIRIIHNNQPYTFQVPSNLEAALKAIRYHDSNETSRIWVDAICINQRDIEERNNQVPLMSNIYGKAQRVYVWLGEEEDDSKMAFDFIENQILNLNAFDRLINDNSMHAEWKAMKKLMMRKWFSRRWIVQEIALAKEAILLCGKHKLDWLKFADAISLFNAVETRTRRLSEVMKSNEEHGHVPDFFGYVPALSATHLVEVTNHLFRRRSDERREPLLSLEYLVSTFTAFDATEPRDTIYALLAIAKDTSPQTNIIQRIDSSKSKIHKATPRTQRYFKWILQRVLNQFTEHSLSKPYEVDYRLPISDIYVQFVDFSIKRSDPTRALDILCRPWAPDPKNYKEPGPSHGYWRAIFHENESRREDGQGQDTIPSWIPSISRVSHWLEEMSGKMARLNADPFVGYPPQQNYAAAGNKGVTSRLRFESGRIECPKNREIHGTHYHSIFVEGFILDKVGRLGPASQIGAIPKEWIKLAQESQKKYERKRENERKRKNERKGEDENEEDENGYTNNNDPYQDFWDTPLADDFWRTLVADRNSTGGNTARYYPRLLKHAYAQATGRSNRNKTLDTQTIIDYGKCQPAGDVLRRIQSVIWNRKFTCTKTMGLFGLVPDEAEHGDFVCILFGCSVPVVLRQHKKSEESMASERKQRKEAESEREQRKEAESEITQREEAESEMARRKKVINAVRVLENWFLRRKLILEMEKLIPKVKKSMDASQPPSTPNSKKRKQLASSPKTPTPPKIHSPNKKKKRDHPAPFEAREAKRDSGEPPEDTPKDSINSIEPRFYQLIGECYVHGMMNGEAISAQSDKNLKKQLFEIR